MTCLIFRKKERHGLFGSNAFILILLAFGAVYAFTGFLPMCEQLLGAQTVKAKNECTDSSVGKLNSPFDILVQFMLQWTHFHLLFLSKMFT